MTRPDLDLSDLGDTYDMWADSFLDNDTDMLDPIVLPGSPLHISTCTDLVPGDPLFAWDVNGWYRHLRIPFPYRVRRTRLAQHYLAVGGQWDARATWIFKQLLQPVVRRSYDLTPLGALYEADPVVQRALKDKVTRAKARALAEGRAEITDEEAAEEIGIDLKENSGTGLDEIHEWPQTEASGFGAYSYWVQDMLDLPLYDDLYIEHLEVWRRLIHRIAVQAGMNLRFSLGLTAGSDYEVRQARPIERLGHLDAAITDNRPAFIIVTGMQIFPNEHTARTILLTLLDRFPQHFKE